MNQIFEFLTLNPWVQGIMGVVAMAVPFVLFLWTVVGWFQAPAKIQKLSKLRNLSLAEVKAWIKPEPFWARVSQVSLATACLMIGVAIGYPRIKGVVEGGPYKTFTMSVDSKTTVIVVR